MGCRQPPGNNPKGLQKACRELGPGAQVLWVRPRGFAMKHLMAKGMGVASAAYLGPGELGVPHTEHSGRREGRARNRQSSALRLAW